MDNDTQVFDLSWNKSQHTDVSNVPVGVFTINKQKLDIYPGKKYTVGRGGKASLVVPIKSLSKEHIQLEYVSGTHIISDLNSKNKTKRGKLVLIPGVQYELPDMTEREYDLFLGDTQAFYHYNHHNESKYVSTPTTQPDTSFTATKPTCESTPSKQLRFDEKEQSSSDVECYPASQFVPNINESSCLYVEDSPERKSTKDKNYVHIPETPAPNKQIVGKHDISDDTDDISIGTKKELRTLHQLKQGDNDDITGDNDDITGDNVDITGDNVDITGDAATESVIPETQQARDESDCESEIVNLHDNEDGSNSIPSPFHDPSNQQVGDISTSPPPPSPVHKDDTAGTSKNVSDDSPQIQDEIHTQCWDVPSSEDHAPITQFHAPIPDEENENSTDMELTAMHTTKSVKSEGSVLSSTDLPSSPFSPVAVPVREVTTPSPQTTPVKASKEATNITHISPKDDRKPKVEEVHERVQTESIEKEHRPKGEMQCKSGDGRDTNNLKIPYHTEDLSTSVPDKVDNSNIANIQDKGDKEIITDKDDKPNTAEHSNKSDENDTTVSDGNNTTASVEDDDATTEDESFVQPPALSVSEIESSVDNMSHSVEGKKKTEEMMVNQHNRDEVPATDNKEVEDPKKEEEITGVVLSNKGDKDTTADNEEARMWQNIFDTQVSTEESNLESDFSLKDNKEGNKSNTPEPTDEAGSEEQKTTKDISQSDENKSSVETVIDQQQQDVGQDITALEEESNSCHPPGLEGGNDRVGKSINPNRNEIIAIDDNDSSCPMVIAPENRLDLDVITVPDNNSNDANVDPVPDDDDVVVVEGGQPKETEQPSNEPDDHVYTLDLDIEWFGTQKENIKPKIKVEDEEELARNKMYSIFEEPKADHRASSADDRDSTEEEDSKTVGSKVGDEEKELEEVTERKADAKVENEELTTCTTSSAPTAPAAAAISVKLDTVEDIISKRRNVRRTAVNKNRGKFKKTGANARDSNQDSEEDLPYCGDLVVDKKPKNIKIDSESESESSDNELDLLTSYMGKRATAKPKIGGKRKNTTNEQHSTNYEQQVERKSKRLRTEIEKDAKESSVSAGKGLVIPPLPPPTTATTKTDSKQFKKNKKEHEEVASHDSMQGESGNSRSYITKQPEETKNTELGRENSQHKVEDASLQNSSEGTNQDVDHGHEGEDVMPENLQTTPVVAGRKRIRRQIKKTEKLLQLEAEATITTKRTRNTQNRRINKEVEEDTPTLMEVNKADTKAVQNKSGRRQKKQSSEEDVTTTTTTRRKTAATTTTRKTKAECLSPPRVATCKNEMITPPSGRRISALRKTEIVYTGIEASNSTKKDIASLCGVFSEDILTCTHLVTDKVKRTSKFLCAVGRGIPIVTEEWVKQSKACKHFLDGLDYLIADKESEKKYSFSLAKSLAKARKESLLTGYTFYVTKNCIPSPSQIDPIIRCNGGEVVKKQPRKFEPKLIILSCSKDNTNQLSKTGIPICTTELILTGVLRQELAINDFLLEPGS